MFIKNCWYVAGWMSELSATDFLSRTILGIPLVFWRDQQGQAVVFEDRCCHRGAPLSKGRKEGDCIRCMYHGLKFDRSGACVEVPGQDRIAPNMRVNAYPVVERHKWIWVWLGDAAQADPALIPDTHWLDDPEWRSLEGYTYYNNTNYLLIADNLLDLAHLPYVHPTTLGGDEAYAASPATVESIPRGVRVSRWALDNKPPGFVQKVRPFEGNVDRWNHYDFVIPAVFLMDSGMTPVGSGAPQGNREGAPQFRGCQALTPETETSTHYFFAHPHNFAIDDAAVTASIHHSVVVAFDEDRDMIMAQARSLALKPDFKMLPIKADNALGRFRFLVEQTIREEAAASGAAPQAAGAAP